MGTFPPAFLISQKSKIFDSFPPGEAFCVLPRQYDKLQFEFFPLRLTSGDLGDKITVTMPISNFTYNMDGTAGMVPITPESFDTFTMWPVSGGLQGTECTPILRYDNIRIVPIN